MASSSLDLFIETVRQIQQLQLYPTAPTTTVIPMNETNETDCPWDDTENLFTRYITSLIGFAIAIVGTMANICNVVVFSRFPVRKPTIMFLNSLAFFDICVLDCYVLLYTVQITAEYHKHSGLHKFWLQYVRPTFPFSRLSQMYTVYIVIVAAIERYATMARPELSLKIFTHRGCKYLVFGVTLLSLACHITRYWETHVVIRPHCTGLAYGGIEASWLLGEELYRTMYGLWFTNVTQVILPFVALAALTILNVRRLNKTMLDYNEGRSDLAEDALQRMRDSTRVMIVIVIVNLICNAFGVCIALWEFFNKSFLLQNQHFYTIAVELINLMAIANSATRGINYLKFNREFRRIAIDTFCSAGMMVELKKLFKCNQKKDKNLLNENDSLLNCNSAAAQTQTSHERLNSTSQEGLNSASQKHSVPAISICTCDESLLRECVV